MDELPLPAAQHTHPGKVHDRNEDRAAVFDTPDGARVLVVCDGMGGMGRGDEAARLAVEVLASELKASGQRDPVPSPATRLRHALLEADDRVRRELYDPDDAAQPGCTAVLVLAKGGLAHVGWVGDSRAYLVRNQEIIGRTRDHKLVEDLIDAGQMSANDARHSSLAHVVTRALGGKTVSEPRVKPAVLPSPWRLMHGDRILVSSDGLTDLVDDSELAGLLDGDLEQTTHQLVELANDRGGHDNITVVLASWDGEDWPEGDEVDLPDEHDLEEHELEDEDDPVAPRPPPEPVDIEQIARDLMPWWIATAALLFCAVVAAWVAI